MASQNPANHTRDFSGVLDREWAHVKAIRGHSGDEQRQALIGLSISGGGIRSASFGLGVLQALVVNEAMPKFDYLSTVSGGGYIGSALTWLLHINPKYGVDPKYFPLRGPRWGTRRKRGDDTGPAATTEADDKDAELRDAEAPPALDFIRQRGNFLTPGHYLNIVSMIAVVLRGTLSTFLVYFALLTGIFYLAMHLCVFTMPATPLLAWTKTNWVLSASIVAALLFVAVAFLYALATTMRWPSATLYSLRTKSQSAVGVLLITTLALLVLGSLPYAVSAFAVLGGEVKAASAATILGALGAVAKFVMDSRSGDTVRGPLGKIQIVATTILLSYGTLLLSYILAERLVATKVDVMLSVAVAVGALAIGFYTNFNYTSPHRMYRDRLMETFLPDIGAIIKTAWQPALKADSAPLHEMCGAHAAVPARYPGPYHIINANVVLVNSENLKFRDRGSDNFILSPLFCGSDATGWIKTSEYIARPKLMPPGRPITLASAMSISGAAANPHTGGAGALARNAVVSFLMSMMNLRLGYMEIHPDKSKHSALLPKRPNLFFPGLGELFSTGFTENSHFIELTDGGHFENTGMYELIRRKMKVIVSTDSGADDGYAFADLSNAMERVRVDFGVNIRFSNSDLRDVVPGSDSVNPALHKHIHFAKRGYAIADIYYADKSRGTLIVIKPTLLPGLPADLYGYKIAQPTFPQQTTADQFFDEAQFESYRELGYQLTKRMLGENVPRGILGLPPLAGAGGGAQTTVGGPGPG
jgi:hypothetical protein